MNILGAVHQRFIFSRRTDRLADAIAAALIPRARVLDVGSGDGTIAALLKARRPDIEIVGIDILVRPDTRIPVTPFDGLQIPHPDRSFDQVLFVDVLHHASDPQRLLQEGARVAGHSLIIKDHLSDAPLASLRLRLMDWVGNARHGVVLPYHYQNLQQWHQSLAEAGLRVDQWQERLHLYPAGLEWIFGRSLHFLARLHIATTRDQP